MVILVLELDDDRNIAYRDPIDLGQFVREFPVRSEFGEVDYRNNDSDLDERLVSILNNNENILEVTTDFEMN